MVLRLQTEGPEGPLGAWIHGSDGFSGEGKLQGVMAKGGHFTLNGRLMLGRHEYECALQASLEGDRIVGEATYLRPSTGETARTSFSLFRS